MCGRHVVGAESYTTLTHPTAAQVAGELTRSASRSFYGRFEDSTSFAEFSRTWNLLVHDWLRRYIFEPTAAASHWQLEREVAARVIRARRRAALVARHTALAVR